MRDFVHITTRKNSSYRECRPLVVINKADRDTARPEQVESDLFDLFVTLGATEDQMEYPTLFASAKQGWAQLDYPSISPPFESSGTELSTGMTPLFEQILSHIPAPVHLDRGSPFSMLTIQIESDPYVGALYTGRIESGVVKVGDTLWALDTSGQKVGEGKVKKLFGRQGLDRIETEVAAAGEIISVAGIKNGGVNITLVAPDGWTDGPQPLPVRL